MRLNILGLSINFKVADEPAPRVESVDRGLYQLYEALWAAGVRGMPTRFDAVNFEGWVLFYLDQALTIKRLESEVKSRIWEQIPPIPGDFFLQLIQPQAGEVTQPADTLQREHRQQADRIKMLEADLAASQAELSQMQAELDHLSRRLVLNQEQINAQAGGQPRNSAK